MSRKKVYFYSASLMPLGALYPTQILSGIFTYISASADPEVLWDEAVQYIRSQCNPPATSDCSLVITSLNRL